MSSGAPPTAERSRNMSAIRSQDTKIELQVRRAVHKRGFRYRIHARHLPGKPDILFARYRLLVLVQGCFWHGHICKEARRPNSNVDYWMPKIEANIARDARVIAELKLQDWDVFIVRECTVAGDTADLLKKLEGLKSEEAKGN